VIKKTKQILKDFFLGIKNEAKETKEASQLIRKHLNGNKLTKEEIKIVREQFYDILRGAGIGIPFMLIPMGSLLIPLMLKLSAKLGVELLPSSFRKEKQINDETNTFAG